MSSILTKSTASTFNKIHIIGKLIQEAGKQHLIYLISLCFLRTLADATGLGLIVTLLLGSRNETALPISINIPLPAGLGILVILVWLRCQLQARVTISQEKLRLSFTDRLRQQLLNQVFAASSTQLDQIRRGDLIGLLMADIGRTAFSLDQAVRLFQACVALLIYLCGVLVVGQKAALPLLLAILATAFAALVQRSGSWQLGQLQSRLNASIHRTVGDGLHSLKAIRAAAAESWILKRFAQETAEGRWLLEEQLRRRSGYNAWRETLVVGVVSLWILIKGEELTNEALITTLLLSSRAGSSLNAIVQAQRFCFGSLPGYEALCLRRRQLQHPKQLPVGSSLPESFVKKLKQFSWGHLKWQANFEGLSKKTLILETGRLVAVTGPSGSGKTTLLDCFCGLLAEEQSQWVVECDEQLSHLSGRAGARQLHELIAYAPQDAVLLEASLRDNLLLGQEQSEEAIKTWLHRLGLNHLLQRGIGLEAQMHLAQDPLSGGEIQRLALIRAWMRNLPVEVLDEPTAFLDAVAAKHVRDVIQERVNKRLVLISTHDQELIRQADQVVRLEPGDGFAVFRRASAPPN